MDHSAFHFYAVMGKEALAENPPAIQRVDTGIAACHFHLAVKEKNLPGHFERQRFTAPARRKAGAICSAG